MQNQNQDENAELVTAEVSQKLHIDTPEVLEKSKSSPPKKSKSKGKKHKPKPSPEEIERIRAERNILREKKRVEMLEKGLDPDHPPELQFIKRPMLMINEKEPESGFVFTLMTYNCLAQALIRRKLFPDSGEALKWFKRSRVLLYEFMHYKPDVICLQEIDKIQYKSFWKDEFAKLGYESQYHSLGTKNHGISIVWKRDLFSMTDKMLIDYDKEESGAIPPRTKTNNAGMILSLKFSDKVLKSFPNCNKSGIIVGTTHLFWHPFGTYERTRQCYVVLNKVKEFRKRVNVLQNGNDGNLENWYPFFCGDFNSQPFDSPYLSMTSKPVLYENRAKKVIECSTSYTFSKLRNGEEDADDEEGGNIEKFGPNQPQTPVPELFTANEEQAELVKCMQDLHNTLDMKSTSLYSVGYKYVHPENSGLDNDRGEPEISNWANTWRGLLDYIFYVNSWDFSNNVEVEPLETFQKLHKLKLKGLLKMPPAKEMPPHGQPHEGEYASDHLSMMCRLELDMN